MCLLTLYMHTFTNVFTFIVYSYTFTHTIHILEIAYLLIQRIQAINVRPFQNVYAALLLYNYFVHFLALSALMYLNNMLSLRQLFGVSQQNTKRNLAVIATEN